MAWDENTAVEEPDWAQLLEDNPRVLWGIVADVVKAVRAGEGERKTGRRPAAAVSSLDELYEVLFPAQYAEAEFPEAFTALLSASPYTQRAFALYMGFHQATVSRLAGGKVTPNAETIERVARGLNVRPTYFREYRAIRLGEIFTGAFLAHPTLSAEAMKRLNWAVYA